MRTVVRKLGNSSGVIIPKVMLDEARIAAGDEIDMTFVEGRIVLVPVRREVRAGWAEASENLARTGGDALVWPEFDNVEDETLDW